MKTKLYMMTVVLVLNISLSFAGDPLVPGMKAASKPYNVSFSASGLAPVAPREATFTDYGTALPSLIRHLSSITLTDVIYDFMNKEAFDPGSGLFSITEFAPVAPAEATFEDAEIETVRTNIKLAPVTPAKAEFNE